MGSVKRITAGLSAFIITGFLFTSCEKMNGPEPYLSLPRTQLLMVSTTPETPLPAIPLEMLQKLVITDAGIQPFWKSPDDPVNGVPTDLVPHTSVGQIIFQ